MAAFGGAGASPGGAGTVVMGSIPAPQVVAQNPDGIVSRAVSNLDLTFSSPMNFSTASGADFAMDTPSGWLGQGSLGVEALSGFCLRLAFPVQTNIGYYEAQAGPQVEDIYGQAMAGPWIGSFVILPPVISGRITDTNGLPVAYVTLHVEGDPVAAVSDTNGNYSVEVNPGWSGTITPSRGGRIFIPTSRSYSNVSADLPNENYVMAPPSALAFGVKGQGQSLSLCWEGIGGVTYQAFYSTDLVNWYPCADPLPGTNAPMTCPVPVGAEPAKFFRLSASY